MISIRRKRTQQIAAAAMIILFLIVAVGGCQSKAPKRSEAIIPVDEFTPYKEISVNIKPAVKPYQVAPDLDNVINRDRFKLTQEGRKLLSDNGFMVVPEENTEFFMVYEMNRYNNIPSFITTDAMLHNYHLFFRHLFKSAENEYLIPRLDKLNKKMLDEALEQYKVLKGTSWEKAIRRNLAFFAVGASLLDPNTAIPSMVQNEVRKELNLINQHEGIEVSPVMSMGRSADELKNLKQDYTKYIPSGHYSKSEDMKSYFKNMTWYGQFNFRLNDEDESKSAVLITLALNRGDRFSRWEKIYQPTNFFLGKSDDIGYYQFVPLLKETYGPNITLSDLSKNTGQWASFWKEAKELKPPVNNSIPLFNETTSSERESEVRGYRFMGQRFALDEAVFGQLIYPAVKANQQGQKRLLPKGLDLAAVMGSGEADSLLKEMGETNYKGYPEKMEKMQDYVAGLKKTTWTQNLYWTWLYTLRSLTGEKPSGYPSFMLSSAWAKKELNTYLGSWTEMKHDAIISARQVSAETNEPQEDTDVLGYVEPNPYLYARLASLTAMMNEGLSSRGLLNKGDRVNLERLEKIALSLKTISEKEINDQPLSDEEYDLIRNLGMQMEHFWREALRSENIKNRSQLRDNPAPVIAGVATALGPGLVLKEGTGYISGIYVVVPIEGKLHLARGGVYSYYEFPWPISDSLTDKEWQARLKNQAPASPPWSLSLIATGGCRPHPFKE